MRPFALFVLAASTALVGCRDSTGIDHGLEIRLETAATSVSPSSPITYAVSVTNRTSFPIVIATGPFCNHLIELRTLTGGLAGSFYGIRCLGTGELDPHPLPAGETVTFGPFPWNGTFYDRETFAELTVPDGDYLLVGAIAVGEYGEIARGNAIKIHVSP